MNKIKAVGLFLIGFLVSSSAFSQIESEDESCVEKLYKANTLYETGKIQEAITLIEGCATDKADKISQWKANRLMALGYIALGQRAKAKRSVEKMLELNPDYEYSSTNDPVEMEGLINSVKLVPKLSLGFAFAAGVNKSYPHVTATYNGTDYTKKYSSLNGWKFAFMAGYNMNEVISLHAGLVASSKKYGIDYKVDHHQFNVEERFVYLDFPLFARFKTKNLYKNLSVFADVGIFSGRLLSSSSDFMVTSPESSINYELLNVNANHRRTNWNYGGLFGVGVLYSHAKFDIGADVRYYAAVPSSVNSEEGRFVNDDLYYDYYYLDDDVRLNNMAFSLSFARHINYKAAKSN